MSPWTVLIIGVGTVFISLFAIIGLVVVLRALLSKKPVVQVKKQVASSADSGELIAVVTVAVAAMLNTNVQNIRIASIEKSGMTAPVWALAERYSRQPQGTVTKYGK